MKQQLSGYKYRKEFDNMFAEQKLKVLIVGLVNAGKTTLLKKIQLSDVQKQHSPLPLIVETVQFQNLQLISWDLKGLQKEEQKYEQSAKEANALIFVIDSSDQQTIDSTKVELGKLLSMEILKETPLLIFANKMNIAKISIPQMVDKLGLHQMKDRKWYLTGSNFETGQGILDGFSWVSKTTIK